MHVSHSHTPGPGKGGLYTYVDFPGDWWIFSAINFLIELYHLAFSLIILNDWLRWGGNVSTPCTPILFLMLFKSLIACSIEGRGYHVQAWRMGRMWSMWHDCIHMLGHQRKVAGEIICEFNSHSYLDPSNISEQVGYYSWFMIIVSTK